MGPRDYVELDGIRYEWLGHSTVRITAGDIVIYTDPVILDDDPPVADLIMISHHHIDHCLPEYVAPIRDEQTKVVVFQPSYIRYCMHEIKRVRTLKIGQSAEFSGVRVTAVEAYTERGFHSRGEGCGFIIEVRGQRIYFSGDTSPTEEMRSLEGIDVAIVSVADNIEEIKAEDIVDAVKEIRPRLFIPVHFTPASQPDPVIKPDEFVTKDPRFFTRKEEPERLLPLFDGTGIEAVVLRMAGSYERKG